MVLHLFLNFQLKRSCQSFRNQAWYSTRFPVRKGHLWPDFLTYFRATFLAVHALLSREIPFSFCQKQKTRPRCPGLKDMPANATSAARGWQHDRKVPSRRPGKEKVARSDRKCGWNGSERSLDFQERELQVSTVTFVEEYLMSTWAGN